MVRRARMARVLGSVLVPSPKRLNFGPVRLSKGQEPSGVKGPFIVTVDFGSPFKIESKPLVIDPGGAGMQPASARGGAPPDGAGLRGPLEGSRS